MSGIWEHITWQSLGVAMTFVSMVGMIVWKFARHDNVIDDHGKQLDEVHGLIESFHGKCDTVNTTLTRTVSWDMLNKHCKEHQENCSKNFCRKIESLRTDLKETKETVDQNYKQTINTLTRIEGFMGAINERNRLIDAERSKRRNTDP